MKKSTVFLMALMAAAPLRAKTYQIDPAHSSVGFKIRHIVGKVPGRFEKLEGSFDYEKDKPETWTASAEIDAASVNTNIVRRDDHLRSADFFDVAKCPKISFKSTKADGKGSAGTITGDLTMHCVTKPVTLNVEFSDEVKGLRGDMILGASAHGTVDRKEFGILGGPAGGMIGGEVAIDIELEAPAKK